MKKYLLKYFNPVKNIWLYSDSVDENGCTYRLVENKKDASRFYGKNALKQIEDKVKKDKKYQRFFPYYDKYEIEEIEEEPHWYFELKYAISQYDNIKKSIKKGFLKFMDENDKQKIIDKHKKYNYKNPEIITVCDLDDVSLELLEKYYYWRKENYKGNPKQY